MDVPCRICVDLLSIDLFCGGDLDPISVLQSSFWWQVWIICDLVAVIFLRLCRLTISSGHRVPVLLALCHLRNGTTSWRYLGLWTENVTGRSI